MKNLVENKYFKNDFYVYLFIAAVILLLYSQTLYFGFTWFDDDWLVLTQSSYYSEKINLLKVFSYNIIPWEYCYYRPILIVSFFTDFFISNQTMSPVFYHLTNILLHMFSASLLFYFLNKNFLSKKEALAWTLVFACHPVLTQAVAWIPGRNDSILFVFAILSFIFYAKALNGKTFDMFLCVLFWALALFTKENAIVMPLLFIFYLFAVRKKISLKKGIVFSVLISIILILFTMMRTNVLGKFTPKINYVEIILNIPKILIIYIGKIFMPLNLSPIPYLPDENIIYGLSVIVILAVLLIFVFKIKNKRLFYFGLAWFALFLIPSLITLQSIMLEPRIYLPFAGLIISLSQIYIPQLKSVSEKIKTSAFAALILLFCVITFSYSKTFESPLVFWQKALLSAPSYHAVYNNLGRVYLENELDIDKAEIYLKKAFEMYGDKKNRDNLEKINEIRKAGGIDEYIKLLQQNK
ncbi:MAG: glycosyltransferase family 39 protein [Endomicrobia bacterium]|nr:glycosyltransferase family 39 protein [Endomicrobiia bacterium]